MQAAAFSEALTEEQYFKLEERSEEKHEFYRGEIIAMAGGTPNHALIAMNVGRELGMALKGRGCFVFGSDMRVKVVESGLITYPDVTVACGERRYSGERELALANPVMIGEVLSESTERHDRRFKFPQYEKIRSVETILFVAQDTPLVEQYTREGEGSWQFEAVIGLKAVLKLTKLGIEVPMAEIYAGVEFSSLEAGRR